ncbi:MAG: ribonuclease R [Bacteroidetes bacterium]|nr:MAG: ribonuclease R [Bacteroidota bacterium]
MKKKKKAISAKSKPSQQKSPRNLNAQLLERQILTFLKAHPEQSFTSKQIGALIGIMPIVSNQELRATLAYLESVGQITHLGKGKLQYTGNSSQITGKIQVTRSGAGFLLMEDGQDIFIPNQSLNRAFNGDTVRIQVLQRRRRKDGQPEGRREGEVLEVVERLRTEFVGVVEQGRPGQYFLIPDDSTIRFDFFIAKDKLNDARPGQKVCVKLLSWERRAPEVEVIRVLGDAGENETEMHAILLQYGFDPHFPPHVEEEAAQIPEKITDAEIARRRDFRQITTLTIDPYDAKDFDDALSFRVLENGNYEVGVHIADVSHYLQAGSAIDKEGFHRATSVYLVDRTVPMLPEKLSNFLCSLRPNEDKLTYSAVFEMNAEAQVINYWIGQTVIHSDYRFNYEEAQEVIDGKLESPYYQELTILNSLAKKLRAARMTKGSIEFESNEVKFVLDENDKPVRVIRKKLQDTNRLIEDFMLLANRTVAAHIFKLFDNPPLPSVYRVHDLPDPEKLGNLQKFVSAFGYTVDFEAGNDPSTHLNELLRKVHGTPEQNVIESIAIRSMAKALYTTKNIGHFGLGFPFYTHFTSPIRRYPDLMVQRLLTQYGNKTYGVNQTDMEAQLRHCSDRERTAAEAERASIKYKQVEFLEDKIGQQFTGIISGVIESGIFVELEENLCEGFAPAHSIEDDYYVYDESGYCLVGRTHGRILRLGDSIKVEIAGTDLRRRTIDMKFISKNS